MITNIRETLVGYQGTYTDRHGTSVPVRGTFAFGPALSWHTESGTYVVISGYDQRRIIPLQGESIRIKAI